MDTAPSEFEDARTGEAFFPEDPEIHDIIIIPHNRNPFEIKPLGML
jgi:hypothetical protein